MYPAQLSGGMRKRVGITRALVYNPDYIIFDEPVSGLDPITAGEVLYYISQINIDRDAEFDVEQITLQNTVKNKSVTLITITHEISNLDQIGDQVLFLDNGNVIFSGSLRDLKMSNDEFINKYLA
jgi:phospholipid/cholesterol/gamma-HCH transport system ATP-binding protein